MENLEQQFSNDLLITQSSNSVREYSDPIPSDLLVDIFSRVPAECIARFRCVSKFWASILGRRDFIELFLTKSVARPRILFVIEVNNNKLFVYSSPQPQNPVENSSLVATRYNYYPKNLTSEPCPPLCGWVFLGRWGREREGWVRLICNPVTGESITLPKVKAATGIETSYFGYDPINKQFKVLCTNFSGNTHRVLTLGTGKRVWRTTMECEPQLLHNYLLYKDICINGVLYYGAYFDERYSFRIVCFDFRFEKFSFIEIDEDMIHGNLINYKGKLCAHRFLGRHQEKLELWVLEDAGEYKWSKSICVLPSSFRETGKPVYIVGTTGTGEIVFSPDGLPNTFYLYYYNIERNTFTRVKIRGLEEFKHHPKHVSIFLDYVENMTLDYASVFNAS